MKVKMEDASPDGLILTMTEGFYFDTYEDALEFIKGVESLKNQIHKKSNERVKVVK